MRKSGICLFKSLKRGQILPSTEVHRILWVANYSSKSKQTHHAYGKGTLDHHADNGRLKTIHRDGKVFYQITDKGRKYARRRKIFST